MSGLSQKNRRVTGLDSKQNKSMLNLYIICKYWIGLLRQPSRSLGGGVTRDTAQSALLHIYVAHAEALHIYI